MYVPYLHTAEVSAWLDESRRKALLRVLGEDPDLDIREGRLEFEREQLVESEEVLEKALEGLRALVPYVKSHDTKTLSEPGGRIAKRVEKGWSGEARGSLIQ